MESKNSAYQYYENELAELEEINSFDIIEDERKISVEDSSDDEVFGKFAASMSYDNSIISNGMVVDGNIDSEKRLTVDGRVNGNVKSANEIKVDGIVVGNIDAANISLLGAKLHGDSKAQNDIIADNSSIIVGDLTAKNISINGKVKGVITASNNVDFKESALVVGDVVTGAIHMDEGSRVNASIRLTNESATAISDDEFDLGV